MSPTQTQSPLMAPRNRDRLGHGSAIHLSFFADALRPIDRCYAELRLALSNHPRCWIAWGGRGGGAMIGAFTRRTEAFSRGARMLRTALGPAIAAWLEDPGVVEVMLNPDGRLWVDRLTEGLIDTGERLAAADGERIVRLVAHHVGAEVHSAAPRVSAELPETGERFEGLLPPVVAAPAFAIRKPAGPRIAHFMDKILRGAKPADVPSSSRPSSIWPSIDHRKGAWFDNCRVDPAPR